MQAEQQAQAVQAQGINNVGNQGLLKIENAQPANAPQGEEEPGVPPDQLAKAIKAKATAKQNRDNTVAQLAQRGRQDIGSMDVLCSKCGAYHWIDEWKSKSTINAPAFTHCCQDGKIQLALPKCPPQPLWELFMGQHPLSGNFFNNIQQFNSALAFVSMGTDGVQEQLPGHGPYVYKIGGSVNHRSGNLEAEPGAPRCYAQLYIYDSDHLEEAANTRLNNPINSNCDQGLMQVLTGVIHQNHQYAALYSQIWEHLREAPIENISMLIQQNCTDDRQWYNRPSTNEIALVMPDGATELQRDIVVYKHGGGIQRINTWNPAYSPLHYVLLFPYGEHGFQCGIPHREVNPQNVANNNEDEGDPLAGEDDNEENEDNRTRTTVSELQFYAYMLFA